MAHITSIGSGLFSDMSVHNHPATTFGTAANWNEDLEFAPLFATESDTTSGTTFSRIRNVREFPSIGTPSNVVNVPVYGSRTSQQVQGQSDAPSLELTLNFVPSEWASNTLLGAMVGSGLQKAFRFTLMNSPPTGSGATQYASSVGGLGTTANSVWYWIGKIEALLVNPQLTDANTATLTLAIQSQFFGAFTYN